jgi:hypothetical protein
MERQRTVVYVITGPRYGTNCSATIWMEERVDLAE